MKDALSSFGFLLLLLGSQFVSADQSLHPAILEKRSPSLDDWILETDVALQRLTHNHPQIMKQYDAFALALQKITGLSLQDKAAILIALKFAADKHQGQKRKDTEQTPYIVHPIKVAHHLLTVGKIEKADILIAALLHDTLEDTQTTFGEIEKSFGLQIAKVVRELTDDKSLPKEERKRLQIIHAPQQSEAAALIKLSDKFDNLKDLSQSPPLTWSRSEIDHYFRWAQYVINGLPKVNAPLKEAVDSLISQHFDPVEKEKKESR